ncbi:MAG: DNA polymerase/3'-5' exonuclease PolX [Trueperaceae bacterium]|nr:MAG: DNA polymerase/3'-5' exonuclease PolX [Trueperaceae bacterium]
MGNAEIAERLERSADLLEIDGANAFRVRAYRNAAEAVAAHAESFSAMVERGADLTELKGIGKDLAAGITALVRDGALPALEELSARVPLGLLDVVQVQGVGPKRAHTLWQQRDVTGLDDLERVARAGRVADLPGFGEKTQAKILSGIEAVRRRDGRVRLGDAEVLVRPLLALVEGAAGVKRAAVAGSLRRGRETIGDVDLLAAAQDPAPVMAALRAADGVREVLGSGDTKTSVLLTGGLQVDLRVVPEAAYGAALVYFTGSKAHNVALRQRAIERGLKLSEYGLFAGDDEEPIAARDERDVYAALELPWIAPELREDRGEVEAADAGRLPELLTLDDIRGDLHWHTTWSDGADDVETMLEACAARGYEYAAITDHSQALRMTGGLDAAKLARQWEALDIVERERERERGEAAPTLLRGLEVDILKDGRLDLDDDWLERLDIVVASVHSFFDLAQADQTERIVRALGHPSVNVLAHPTGRLLGRRDGIDVDLDAIFAAAAEHGVAIECNASPYRLDASDVHLMRAVRAGCTIVIDSDAHAAAGLDDMRFGVLTARRAWLGVDQVLNAWPLERVRAFLGRSGR